MQPCPSLPSPAPTLAMGPALVYGTYREIGGTLVRAVVASTAAAGIRSRIGRLWENLVRALVQFGLFDSCQPSLGQLARMGLTREFGGVWFGFSLSPFKSDIVKGKSNGLEGRQAILMGSQKLEMVVAVAAMVEFFAGRRHSYTRWPVSPDLSWLGN